MRSFAITATTALLAALAGCSAAGSEAGRLSASLRAGLLSGELGASLPERAARRAAEAEFRALESGQTGSPVGWKVSEALQGSVVPQQPFSVGAANCRRYTHTISQSGQIRTATGTACRREDGIWRPLN